MLGALCLFTQSIMKISSLLLAVTALSFFGGCVCWKQATPPTLEAQFKKADANEDGKVSRKEFHNLMVEDAFALFDANRDGVVTVKEFVAGGGTAEAFRKFDPNGTGKITVVELKASKIRMDAVSAAFLGADVSKDGYVTLEEALKYRERVRSYTR